MKPIFCFSQVDDQAQYLKKLSEHPVWLKLLHYESNKSAIHSDSFFLSANGNVDSESELLATLSAFKNKPSNNLDDHAQCRFKGRYIWLVSQLPAFSHDKVKCPAFDTWTLGNSIDSLSIIFATGYLGNPASYYGHTLLKFNTKNATSKTRLEDVSINFGAIIPDNEGPIPYIFKGIFGGYDSGFSHVQYYYHNHNYGENELRDLWGYELNLSDFQRDLIIGHTWEVLGKNYTYYFLNKNCVYRMAELLEVVGGLELVSNGDYITIPQELLQKIAVTKLDGKPLVKKVEYYPSRQSRLYNRYKSLSAIEKSTTAIEIDNNVEFNTTEFQNLKDIEQQHVVDTLIDYYQFLISPNDLDTDDYSHAYKKVLRKRFQLPAESDQLAISELQSPDKGRKPSLLQVNSFHNESRGPGMSIRIRPAYYDALDANAGHVENAALSMAELEVRVVEDTLYLEQITLINIESIHTSSTGLPGDKPFAWNLYAGIKAADLICDSECLVPQINAGLGYVISMQEKNIVGGVINAGLQESKFQQGAVSLSASVFVNLHAYEKLKSRLIISHKEYVLGSASSELAVKLESHYQYNDTWGLRGYVQKNNIIEAGFGLGYYF